MEIGEVEKLELGLQRAFDLIARIGIKTVPLVDRNHQCPPGFNNKTGNMRVLIRNILPRIKHHNHHVGIFDRLQRLDH